MIYSITFFKLINGTSFIYFAFLAVLRTHYHTQMLLFDVLGMTGNDQLNFLVQKSYWF